MQSRKGCRYRPSRLRACLRHLRRGRRRIVRTLYDPVLGCNAAPSHYQCFAVMPSRLASPKSWRSAPRLYTKSAGHFSPLRLPLRADTRRAEEGHAARQPFGAAYARTRSGEWCSRLRRSPGLPPPHIAAKFRPATTARNVRGHVLRPVVLASLEGRPPGTAGFVVRARLARDHAKRPSAKTTERRLSCPLRVALAGRTPRRKQNRFYAHARRLAGFARAAPPRRGPLRASHKIVFCSLRPRRRAR